MSTRELVMNHLETCDLRYAQTGLVAAQLGIPRSTFTHRLFCEGTSFSILLREERMRRVREALEANPRASGKRIASLCGYTDTHGFYIAFNTWFGLGFREYCRLQKYCTTTTGTTTDGAKISAPVPEGATT